MLWYSPLFFMCLAVLCGRGAHNATEVLPKERLREKSKVVGAYKAVETAAVNLGRSLVEEYDCQKDEK